ncbi:MAG: threonylcarbamoyl-AMP synthase [Candidatus Bathyarchaeum sp.]|nr:MAG: threonylcarbamoyl-AMP synthase [Candidatus Bathyarchaeum sp.]
MTVLKATKTNIRAAAQIVRRGGLVVYPTETVYGLGCDPLNVQAVKRVLDVKGDRKKPLPVLAASIVDADKVAFVSPNGKKLAAKFWPGHLTMVFPKKPALPDIVTFGWDSVGLRIPNNDVALQLISLSGGLLIGSSANRTGEEPARRVQEISGELKEMVDVVLDGGPAVQGRPSTVVDLTSEKPRILREGPISLKAILYTLALSD